MSISANLELIAAALMVAFYARECTHLVHREWKRFLQILHADVKATAKLTRVAVVVTLMIVLSDPIIFYAIHVFQIIGQIFSPAIAQLLT